MHSDDTYERVTLADLMSEAREALLSCRWDGVLIAPSGDTTTLLGRLRRSFSRLPPDALGTLSPEHVRLFAALQVVVAELDRLNASGESGAIRSLGYAVHVLPDVIVSGEWSAKEFRGFNFRVAAFYWSTLSSECKQALCELAGISAARAAELVASAGFVVDMFGRDRS